MAVLSDNQQGDSDVPDPRVPCGKRHLTYVVLFPEMPGLAQSTRSTQIKLSLGILLESLARVLLDCQASQIHNP